ncbi:hypothetical protein BGZ51_006465 [Haplosporangium sp. Z 767]|nr:hypothetical protein BGZ51_006465 [Haplosporangium sp. Z 767]KAF9190881.1 hypothetical protein BGZ50_009759 [Haplosporangium sp. Z 11]
MSGPIPMPMGMAPNRPYQPGPGFASQQPLRPFPSHFQRPPFEQPLPPLPPLPKSANPLEDLVETEKEYVSDLKILLQRVSAGWTQDYLPPREVDEMLRNIEDIHAINRKLSKKLDEIMGNEDVAKGLETVLIWFVDAMEASYSNYCRNHEPLLDNWPEIINNTRLQEILAEIAAEQFQHVTLDSFLMKPIDRLHYYRRLYLRLLDSSERGNPDFGALEGAFIRIDTILRLVTVDVPGTSRHPASPALSGISNMSALRQALPSPPITDQISPNLQPQARNPMSPTLPPSPLSPGMSPNHRPQPNGNDPSRTSKAMLELERTLDTTKVLDLFTMQPKACLLSLSLIEREVLIRGNYCFTITADDGVEDRFEDGHVLLLSDLLLMCRTKTPEEIQNNPEGDTSSYWLLFPPLAIRHVIANDGTQGDQIPIVEMTIVSRVRARIWTLEDGVKFDWINMINNAQQLDSAKAHQQQQQQQPQQQLQGQQLNRNFTQSRPMRPMGPMGPGSPLSPTFQSSGPPPQHFNSGPLSPQFQAQPGPYSPQFQGQPGGPMSPRPRPPMLAMGGRPPMGGPMNPHMGGMPSPGYRPQMSPNGSMNPGQGPGPGPGMMHHHSTGPMQAHHPRPFNRAMSMRRANTVNGRPGAPRGRILQQGDVAAAREVIYKTKPCDVFQWREENWEPLVEDDDCFVELRLTTANRLAMAVTTFEYGHLVLNAWIVESTTFRRASETDISVSMDMGASVQWFLVALNSAREAEDFCAAFQRTKDRAMYDPSLQKSVLPVLSRGDSLASTVMQKSVREKPVKQTLSSMYPPCDCKLFLQAGDHGQWVNLGTARVEIKMEKPSGYVRLFISLVSGNKRVLESAIVQCDCLELVGPKKLAITLMNPQEKMSIIYMLQFKDEAMTTKIFEGLSLNESE